MNISKKALMSFLMALTSLTAMAQPYYHVMKRDGINLTEEAAYNAKKYKIKVDMIKPAPDGAIPGKVDLTDYSCNGITRSFYFTKFGNLYIDTNETETVDGQVMGKFKQEEKQYTCAQTGAKAQEEWNAGHKAYFAWAKSYDLCCLAYFTIEGYVHDAKANDQEGDFWISQKDTQKKLKRDLGNQEWAVLSKCEMGYIMSKLGDKRGSYKIYTDNTYTTLVSDNCFMIDLQTTFDESGAPITHPLLDQIKDYKLSVEEFEKLEAQGLVCLPAAGYRSLWDSFEDMGADGIYWTCSPFKMMECYSFSFYWSWNNLYQVYVSAHTPRTYGLPVRLVILAD